ncbi:MAG: hypothetical protein IT211_03365 [Armatimonadetes bacterium]|nr:hypothetical protein [Armatimonadota bacterium]
MLQSRGWLAAALLLATITIEVAQSQPTHYPTILYKGENRITIKHPKGIERVRATSTRGAQPFAPNITGCPNQVDVRVLVLDASPQEKVTFTVFDCDGNFFTFDIASENWTIRHERSGPVMIGGDTCLQCFITTSDEREVDSIFVTNPQYRVIMPPKQNGKWIARGDNFKYQVCFRAERVETRTDTVRLAMRRGQPNGGLTHYTIEKPITTRSVPVPPPPPPPKVSKKDSIRALLPPLTDPTTFRNVVMPTAESLGKGRAFVGSYDVAGLIGGYGITDRITVIGGGTYVPAAISQLLVGTIGAKWEFFREGELSIAVGGHVGYSSIPESDITLAAPFAVVSFGDRESRLNLAAGYSWKHHVTPFETFNRKAAVVGIGGDITLGRGFKMAAEGYVLESSGIAPVVISARWFGERWAFDAGLGADLANTEGLIFTSSLGGEIKKVAIAPILSFLWKW